MGLLSLVSLFSFSFQFRFHFISFDFWFSLLFHIFAFVFHVYTTQYTYHKVHFSLEQSLVVLTSSHPIQTLFLFSFTLSTLFELFRRSVVFQLCCVWNFQFLFRYFQSFQFVCLQFRQIHDYLFDFFCCVVSDQQNEMETYLVFLREQKKRTFTE